MSLHDLMLHELPLNRKERFYTGTVFPMIVCKDNFRHFSRLTDLLGVDLDQPINPSPHHANIQFFTEYSLVKSIYGLRRADTKLLNPPQAKDTPDIMILITGPHKILIALEAKMYDTPTGEALNQQMCRQTGILQFIKARLTIDQVAHYALVPDQLARQLSGLTFSVITWQQIYATFAEISGDDYFLSMLRIALDSYDDLVARRHMFGRFAEDKLKGRDIYGRFKSGTLEYRTMGRQLGLSGAPLQEDIIGGGWREQRYEVSSQDTPPSRNWFSIAEFVSRIDAMHEPGLAGC